MIIKNNTSYNVSTALREAVFEYPTDGLTVEIKYCPRGSRRYISGTYYRVAHNYENGKLIRLRINRGNHYPIAVQFKTSEYYRRRDTKGREIIYQKLRTVLFHTPEDLILAIFLHEFSHYLDHIEGRNGRYKQTKADKFAISMLERLGVI
jgi:hypothetical protein